MVTNHPKATAAKAENRTLITMRQAQHQGEVLISRAEAKRLANQFGRAEEVVLDFDGVNKIGPAFADELFRVFPMAHPHITITSINTEPAVDRMIRRALAERAAGERLKSRS